VLVVVLVLENPDRFAIRLTEQISSIGLFAVTESQCTEDEDDSKFRNLGLAVTPGQFIAMFKTPDPLLAADRWKEELR
jgi:hypothetical protein